MIQRVQKTVEVPQIQFIDKFVDTPVGVQAEPEIELEMVECTTSAWPGVNPDITDPVNPLLSITDGEGSTPHIADPSCRKRKGSDITQSPRARAVMRTHDDDDRCEIIASTDELVAKSGLE